MAGRFNSETGCHYEPRWLANLTDEELLDVISALDYWDEDLCREACYRAHLIDEFDLSENDVEFLVAAAMSMLEA